MSLTEMDGALPAFDDAPILKYLGLTQDDQPSSEPIAFLQKHLRQLPPHLLTSFAINTTPRQRTVIPTIRNRRLKYTSSQPVNLSFQVARNTWPTLWHGRERGEQDEREDEKRWADSTFLDGQRQHIGKLGTLLGDYAEEREVERVRSLRKRAAEEEFVPEEEDSDDSDELEGMNQLETNTPEDSPEEARATFERSIRERFIYGLLDSIDYDAIDWDDQWDSDNERDDEERWFDDEEESTSGGCM